MTDVSIQIHELIDEIEPLLHQMSAEEVRVIPNQGGWSKKEILGHLIDSATNNHQRIVRGVQNLAMAFPPYDQTRWVAIQGYHEIPWTDLVEFFCQYNRHVCRVIDKIPQESLQNLCNIGREKPVSLEFIIKDYLRHLRHHIDTIITRKV